MLLYHLQNLIVTEKSYEQILQFKPKQKHAKMS